MTAIDRPVESRPEATDVTAHKLLADSDPGTSPLQKEAQLPTSKAVAALPNLSIVDQVGSKTYDKNNGNLIESQRQFGPNSSETVEVDKKGDQITIDKYSGALLSPTIKEQDQVTTKQPNGDSTTIYTERMTNGTTQEQEQKLVHSDKTGDISYDIDPKTGKPIDATLLGKEVNGQPTAAGVFGPQVTFDPKTGKPSKVYEYPAIGQNGPTVEVDFDPKTGKPNQIIDSFMWGPTDYFKIDPTTGKATPEPALDLPGPPTLGP